MKNLNLLILAMFVAGCGSGKKNPVGSDLKTIREEGKTIQQTGPQQPKEVVKTVVVEKPQLVTREESTLDDKFLVITPDPQMSFNEGQTSTYKIHARVLVAGVKIKLVAGGLPAGASLEASTTEKDLYLLTWTPAFYTISGRDNMKTLSVKLTAQVISADNAQNAEKLKTLVREKEVSLYVFRNQELPKDLKITGLAQEIVEGDEPTAFSVTVKVPGLDDKSAQKPILVVRYDGVKQTAGQEFLEHNGARHIITDMDKPESEYLGNYEWKFNLLFDAKNIPAEPQKGKNGQIIGNADGTRVRASFKVYNGYGLSTAETVYQVKIKYNKKISSPRFDMMNLGKSALEVSRGETVDLKFVVSTTSAKDQVKVVAQESSLPGSPSVTCQNSKEGSFKQNCLLHWKVPCDVSPEALTGEIAMTATSELADPTANTTQYSLKTLVAKAEKSKLCSTSSKTTAGSNSKPRK